MSSRVVSIRTDAGAETTTTESRTTLCFALGAFLLPLALFLATCCRDIFWMDSAEFILVGKHLALSHPPGYPFLLLILRLVSLVPVLSLPFRLNLVSALAASGSCLILFHLVYQLTHDATAALISALIWATSFELWQQATALEVYAFQVLIVSLILLMIVKWTIKSDSRYLLGAAFFFGLGLANHLFTLTLAPGLLLMLAGGHRQKTRLGTLLIAVLLLIPGFALYLYVPLRTGRAALNYWGGTESLSGLVEYLTGRVYRYRLLAGGTEYLRTQLVGIPGLFARQFTVFWSLALAGAVALWKRSRSLLTGLGLATLLSAAFSLAYNIPDKEGYLLPVWLASALLIGCGLAALRRTRFSRTITAIVCLGILIIGAISYPRQNRSPLHGLADLSRAVIAELPERAVVFTNDYSIFQGIRWIVDSEARERSVTVVSEHHLVFLWYLLQLENSIPVSERALRLSRQLWNRSSRLADAAFGEEARKSAEDIRYELTRSLLPSRPVFWIPRDFGDWPREWRGYTLTLHGLSYQVSAFPDSVIRLPVLLFPGPDRYNTSRFRDPETQDLCRRIAATANRRGMLRFERGDVTGALADFALALAYDPEYTAPTENKGQVYYFSGQRDSAEKYLKLFLELDPRSPEVPKVRSLLERLDKRIPDS